jgi:hypothetical protein
LARVIPWRITSAMNAQTRQQARMPSQAKRWEQLCADLLDPAAELDCETFAVLLSTFIALRKAGRTFDPAVVALMAVLARQCDDEDRERDYADEDQDENPEWGSRPATSDQCLEAMLNRVEQERRWR